MMLRVEGVKKSYGSGDKTIEVLKGVDLNLGAGETAALVGPSGVGKSTLLHLIGGLDRPDEGRIFVDDIEVTTLRGNALDAFRCRTVGIVYQFHFLLPEFTAVENVMMPAITAGEWKGARKLATDLLNETGLSERVDHFPSKLSGGEQQRVALARALMNRPKLLLADEPTGNLDEETARKAFSLLLELKDKHGLTVLIATHNPGLAAACGKTLHLREGLIE